MSLRIKILYVFLVFTIIFSVVVYVIRTSYVMPQFNKLQIAESIRNINNFQDVLDMEIKHLDILCHDWAAWDDSYQFVQDINQKYIDSVLADESVDTSGVNMLYYYDTNNNLVWGNDFKFHKSYKMDTDLSHADHFLAYPVLYQHRTPDDSVKGLAVIDGELVFVSSRPILQSEKNGPIRGTLIMGRVLTDEYIEDLEKIIGVPFEVWVESNNVVSDEMYTLKNKLKNTPNNIYVDDTDNSIMRSYVLLYDLNGNDSIIIAADFPKEIIHKAVAVVESLIVMLVLWSLLLFVLLYLCMGKLVLNPVHAIIAHIRKAKESNDLSMMMEWDKKDEIGELSKELDQLFNQLDIANLVNLEIQKQINEKNELLERLNITDVMTNLFNKRHLSEVAKLEFSRAKRHNHPLSLIVVDVDHFKKINDFFGHNVGDDILKRIANLLQNATRDSDIVARFGGEEFVVLAPVTDHEGILGLAERLRKSIEGESSLEIEKDLFVSATASFGVATYYNDNYQTLEQLFQSADEALLKAKRNGRNRVYSSQQPDISLDIK